ncbi:hypothetical protein BOTBODRAFT_171257 [Botryobasidium botryosum FD-172 SS1]|uniref:F-box domain-containing protein n=1 Tax=Botryobasidium botryosum (strain FD-172 SS1) TaxID=930990 RepID=A0A067N2R6_BOTB1|nr:hypothetical protein BOTBODRAFT_171257 [Botryobasidium botryosum FD-172 SS1]
MQDQITALKASDIDAASISPIDVPVRSRRNHLTPIYRLPDDIYISLFDILQNDRGPLEPSVIWAVSQVSRLWRQIAFNTPKLSCIINVLAREFVDRCIAYSRNLPLDIILRDRRCVISNPTELPFESEVRDVIPSLISCISRWRVLELQQADGGTSISVRDNLFAGCTPKLRYLHLNGVSIPFSTPVYSNLVSLCLEFVDHTLSTSTDFLRSLKACPLLEHLHLQGALIGQAGPWDKPPVHLPHLRYIYIEGIDDEVTLHLLCDIGPSHELQLAMPDGYNVIHHVHRIDALHFKAQDDSILVEGTLHDSQGKRTLMSLQCEVCTSMPFEHFTTCLFCTVLYQFLFTDIKTLSFECFPGDAICTGQWTAMHTAFPVTVECLEITACGADVVKARLCLPFPLERLSIVNCSVDGEQLVLWLTTRASRDWLGKLSVLRLVDCDSVGDGAVERLKGTPVEDVRVVRSECSASSEDGY